MTGYVEIKRFDHFGEYAVPTGKVKGDEAEFILLNCQHGEHKVWLKREDITYPQG